MRALSFRNLIAENAYRGPLYARPRGVFAAVGMGAGASLILLVAMIANRHTGGEPVAVAVAEAPVVHLTPVAKIATKILAAAPGQGGDAQNAAIFDLKAPNFENETKAVSTRDAEGGEGRIDSLSLGKFALNGPFMRLDVHQGLGANETNADFFLDMTRHAAQQGLTVARIGQPAAMTTRFGSFETADIRLSQTAGEGAAGEERSCLATRLVDQKLSLEIAGIACGAGTGKSLDRLALACALDNLEYSAAGDNKALNDFFLNAELARGKGCANISRDDVTASIPPHKAAAAKGGKHKVAAKAARQTAHAKTQ